MSTHRRIWASLLFSTLLFLIIAFAVSSFKNLGIPEYARIFAFMLLGSILLAYAQKKEGIDVVLSSAALSILFLALSLRQVFASTAILSVGMTAATFYIYARRRSGFKATLRKLGITRNKLWSELKYGFLITLAIYAILLVLMPVYNLLGIQDAEGVVNIIRFVPWFIIILAVVVNPITEELFFRGILAPRMGIIGSSIIFALFHLAYGSVVEMINVFWIGLIYAHIYLSRHSLIAPIISHMIINATAIYFMRFGG
ncbi:hypothetical protein DRN67_02105 [Candidatus Micrarchaeota archaeon]|nr:MAG: hypothetical protein DRN67_02105 [Candidatus Micrarchaeota archaeon]